MDLSILQRNTIVESLFQTTLKTTPVVARRLFHYLEDYVIARLLCGKQETYYLLLLQYSSRGLVGVLLVILRTRYE